MLATVTLGVGGYQWFQYTRINDFLTRAEVRLANGQLIAPALDNADYYYRRALRLDADNPKALDGLKRVLNARIAESLVLAEQRLAEDQLLEPAEDSAVHYFRQVLGWLPENEAARVGLERVSQRYTELAEAAYGRREYAVALEYIHQGLEATPEQATLLALRDGHLQRVAKARAPRVAKRTAVSTARTTTSTPAQAQAPANPVKRLWNRIFN
jgi:tetratricopeptide (TPR) repeat protein